MTDPSAIFLPDGPGRFLPTELARGPWDPRALHGGAPAGLLAGALEAMPSEGPMAVVRITYELLRPVPLAPLTVATRPLRPGRRVQLLEGTIADPDGEVVVRAVALRVRRESVPVPAPGRGLDPVAPPEASEPLVMAAFADAPPMFAGTGMELRFARGSFDALGPATAWLRLAVPLVGGQEPTPLQRLVAAADFGNGVSAVVPWSTHVFINPDLTVHAERAPRGEWIGLAAETRLHPDGAGLAETVLFDADGRVGRGVQSLYVAPAAT